jgi:hypothetical protein
MRAWWRRGLRALVRPRGRDVRCSFCGKRCDRVEEVVAGAHGARICAECVELARAIIAARRRDDRRARLRRRGAVLHLPPPEGA